MNRIIDLILKDPNINETFKKGVEQSGTDKGTNGKAN